MTVYLEYEGAPRPIDELRWVQRAKCGCISGVTVVDTGDGRPLLTPDDVRAEFADGIKALIKRSVEDGKTYELRDTAWWRAATRTLTCGHEPKWGICRVEAPEGWVWATTSTSQLRSHIRHLAPAAAIGDWRADHLAMCNYKPRGQMWRVEPHYLEDTVTCRKCEARTAEGEPS